MEKTKFSERPPAQPGPAPSGARTLALQQALN